MHIGWCRVQRSRVQHLQIQIMSNKSNYSPAARINLMILFITEFFKSRINNSEIRISSKILIPKNVN